ncbi:MAG: CcmD family protein [Flavobacteriales bacterium]|nr:CcmD family protein [Flavobacteriales bacterium]
MMKYFLTFIMLAFSQILLAQEIEMADQMRADGKIYVVVGVLLIILIGFLLYLVSIDKKLKRLEKEVEQDK